jgi:predicted outer membrane repeat protein
MIRCASLCLLVIGACLVPSAHSLPRGSVRGVHSVPVPAAGRAVGTSHPNHIVGHGTAATCTSAAVVAAVRAGGIIRFSCGREPVTIRMSTTAKVMNTSPQVVIDGGGRVTLSGEGRRRILYMDTCDPAQVWTTSHCQDQASPRLVIENITFADGNSSGQRFDGGGGGAIFARGGRVRIVNAVFAGNRCDADGPDIGGGAVRVLSQYRGLPVYVVKSQFTGNLCSNGGALSSIGVSWMVLNSRLLANRAVGHGANPTRPGTPGGGSGGAIYNDGDEMTLSIGGSSFEGNRANEGGGAIFFVSDDRAGTMAIRASTLERNPNNGFQTAGLPGIFFLGARQPAITGSILR